MDPKALRLAQALRKKAEAAVKAADAADARAGIDRDALAHAWSNLGGGGDRAHRAILKTGMTVAQAAAECGTTPDQLRKAWSPGPQFRPARPEWRRALARFGVPLVTWRNKP